MLSAQGEYCLMVDADGATQFSDLGKLLDEMKKIENNGHGIVVGSRSHLVTTEAVVKVVLKSGS
jgi:dolichyl-phosphate beta-glucosyltransferase